jgi:hypothetical protein
VPIGIPTSSGGGVRVLRRSGVCRLGWRYAQGFEHAEGMLMVLHGISEDRGV